MNKRIVMIVGGSLLLVLCVLTGAFFLGPMIASAQSSSNSSTTSTACQTYEQALADSLHISTTTLHQDQVAARKAAIAQEVKDGVLTQAQADARDSKLDSSQACSGKGGDMHLGILRQTLIAQKSTLLTQIATGLHLSSTQLQSDLQQGQTLSKIAKAQKVTESQLHTIVINAATSALSQAQQAGTITAKEDAAFVSFLKNHPGIVDRLVHHNFAKAK